LGLEEEVEYRHHLTSLLRLCEQARMSQMGAILKQSYSTNLLQAAKVVVQEMEHASLFVSFF